MKEALNQSVMKRVENNIIESIAMRLGAAPDASESPAHAERDCDPASMRASGAAGAFASGPAKPLLRPWPTGPGRA